MIGNRRRCWMKACTIPRFAAFRRCFFREEFVQLGQSILRRRCSLRSLLRRRSHFDFRTPLQWIVGTDVLTENEVSLSQIEEDLHRIHRTRLPMMMGTTTYVRLGCLVVAVDHFIDSHDRGNQFVRQRPVVDGRNVDVRWRRRVELLDHLTP